MKKPRKAVILAAGYGTRMYPLSELVPKALMPLWGKPMLGHALDQLERWGVREAAVNTHHHADQIFTFLKTYPTSLRIQVSYEPEILGTGGPLRRLAWFLDEHPFWMLNADMASEVNPAPLLKAMQQPRTLSALWLVSGRGPQTVIAKQNTINAFSGGKPGMPGSYTFSGLHLLSPKILDFIPDERFSSIITAYTQAKSKGYRVAGVEVPHAYWADIGTPEQYLAAHRETERARRLRQPGGGLAAGNEIIPRRSLRNTGISLNGVSAAARKALVQKGAVLEDTILWPGSTAKGTAQTHQVIAGPGTVLTGRHTGPCVPLSTVIHRNEVSIFDDLGLPSSCTADFLGRRGSERTFFRIHGKGKTAIFIRYSASREENLFYAEHSRFLAKLGLHVPRVLAHIEKDGLLVLEDFGDRSLESAFPSLSATQVERVYRKVIDQVLLMHRHGPAKARSGRVRLNQAFTRAYFEWEIDLFVDQFLKQHWQYAPAFCRTIKQELLTAVSHKLVRLPRALLHRDLQSSNIYLTRQGPGLIDFQGMRLGPAVYDLASLLFDPYVELPEEMIERLADGYASKAPGDWNVKSMLPLAAIQRLSQALGAFARLGRRPSGERFLGYIMPACRRLEQLTRSRPGLENTHNLFSGIVRGQK